MAKLALAGCVLSLLAAICSSLTEKSSPTRFFLPIRTCSAGSKLHLPLSRIESATKGSVHVCGNKVVGGRHIFDVHQPTMSLRGGFNMDDAEKYLSGFGIIGLDMLDVAYTSETGSVCVEAGTDFGDFDTSDTFLARQPHIEWSLIGAKCTLLMIDPDAPDRAGDGSGAGIYGPWLHWLVTDAQVKPEKGTTLVQYMGPAPPKGKHRYIFILFKQKPTDKVVVGSITRKKWDFGTFLKDNPNLEPIAYNMFYTTAAG